MARSFQGIQAQPFIGTVSLSPVAKDVVPVRPFVCPIHIAWSIYGASSINSTIGVQVTLAANNAFLSNGFRVVSVYIDNLNSNVPIYIVFPDTPYTVVGLPQSAKWYPVVTNATVCTIYGSGFVTGQIPSTNLLFGNFYADTDTDFEQENVFPQYIGSPVIQRTNVLTPGFGVPALGDQVVSPTIDCSSGNFLPIPAISEQPAGTNLYLTMMRAYLRKPSSADPAECNVQMRDQNGRIYFQAVGSLEGEVLFVQGNLRFDGSLQYFLLNLIPVAGASMIWNIVFTQNTR